MHTSITFISKFVDLLLVYLKWPQFNYSDESFRANKLPSLQSYVSSKKNQTHQLCKCGISHINYFFSGCPAVISSITLPRNGNNCTSCVGVPYVFSSRAQWGRNGPIGPRPTTAIVSWLIVPDRVISQREFPTIIGSNKFSNENKL